jgi:ADP-ribosylglycohydrolase
VSTHPHVERERVRGAIMGHAIGDALGAPVEFLTRPEILATRGREGLTGFEPWDAGGTRLPAGSYTDDTQMMIATAVGLLRGLQRARRTGYDDTVALVHDRYIEWLGMQDIPTQSRRPGATCLSALRGGTVGTVDDPLNESKGSGGIMRITPVGLALGPERAFELGCEIAALTHGHPSGYLAAGFLSEVLARLVRGQALAPAVAETRQLLLGWDDYDEVLEKVDLAVELFIADADLDDGLALLGEGWVADEALGIALFSALNFPDDFDAGVLASVNITGDSDTTGCVTGALLGALLGLRAIPGEWVDGVEDAALLLDVADAIFAGFAEDGPLDTVRFPAE